MAATAVESAMEAVAVASELIIAAPEVVAADPIIISEAFMASTADCAVAKPTRAERTVAFEKCMFAVKFR
jgi:hypothetical protein